MPLVEPMNIAKGRNHNRLSCLLGPTGVGKVLLAKELANFIFDSEEDRIHIDIS